MGISVMNKDFAQPSFISVPEAARLCGVTRNTVFTWVKKGKLPAYQTPGRTNRIRPADLVHFMEQNAMFVPPDLAEAAHEDEKSLASETSSGTVPPADVLVVDDNDLERNLVVRVLRDKHNVLQAETGYEGLHLLTMHPQIRVVLLDLHMPGQHGLDTLRELRDLRPDVAVIIITGFRDELPKDVREDAYVIGMLGKPFGVEELEEAVEAAFALERVAS